MASMAVEPSRSLGFLEIPPAPKVERARRKSTDTNRSRFLSRAVRQRNTMFGRPWYQPSKSSAKVQTPRSQELAAAIQEELDDTVLSPEEFWVTPAGIMAYSDCAAEAYRIRLEQAEDEVHVLNDPELGPIEYELCEEHYDLKSRSECERLKQLLAIRQEELMFTSSAEERRELEDLVLVAQAELEVLHIVEEALSPYEYAA